MKTMPKIVLALSALATFGVSAETYYSGQSDAERRERNARTRWRIITPAIHPHARMPTKPQERCATGHTRLAQETRHVTHEGANAARHAGHETAEGARHVSDDVNAKVGGPPKNKGKANPEGVNPVGVSSASPTAPSNGTTNRRDGGDSRRDPITPRARCARAPASIAPRRAVAPGAWPRGRRRGRRASARADAERPAERPPAAVFHADVANTPVRGQRCGDQRLRGATVAAPRGAEFEQGRSGERVDLRAGRFAGSEAEQSESHRVEREAIASHATVSRRRPRDRVSAGRAPSRCLRHSPVITVGDCATERFRAGSLVDRVDGRMVPFVVIVVTAGARVAHPVGRVVGDRPHCRSCRRCSPSDRRIAAVPSSSGSRSPGPASADRAHPTADRPLVLAIPSSTSSSGSAHRRASCRSCACRPGQVSRPRRARFAARRAYDDPDALPAQSRRWTRR